MKTTVNNGKRTALFWFLAATFFLSLMAHGAGAAKFGTLRNSDWVVTNAWIAASNRVDSFVSNYTFRVADDGTNYANWVYESATNYANSVAESSTNYTDSAISNVIYNVGVLRITDGTNTVFANLDVYGKTLVPIVATNLYNSTLGVLALQSMEPFGSSWANETAQVFIMGDDWTGKWRLILLPSGTVIEGDNGSAFDETITIGGYTFVKQYVDGTKEEIGYAGRIALTNNIAEAISTNNAAFVAAVLAAPIVGASPSDLADIAEYGSYGTVGAAILALIAGLAALKRDKASKADLPYPFATATVTQDGPQLPASAFPIAGSYNGTAFSLAESDITIAENESTGEWMVLAYSGSLTICVYTSAGAFSAAGTGITNLTFGGSSTPPSMEFPNVLTVSPRTVATFTATSTQASFTVAVGTGVSGAARDCVLVVDCATNTGAVAPTVTWPSDFHPRGDAEEIAPVAGVRNVFYISEYAAGEFVVGGWHEEAE